MSRIDAMVEAAYKKIDARQESKREFERRTKSYRRDRSQECSHTKALDKGIQFDRSVFHRVSRTGTDYS